VVIDYGTGYFVERPIDKATLFCDRKLKLLNESQEKLQAIINQKKQFMDKLNIELQKRVHIFSISQVIQVTQ
jgi:prefoldin alpha subunit